MLPKFSGQKNKPRRPYLRIFFSLRFFFHFILLFIFVIIFLTSFLPFLSIMKPRHFPLAPPLLLYSLFRTFLIPPYIFTSFVTVLNYHFCKPRLSFTLNYIKKFSSQFFFSLPFRDLPTPSSESSPFQIQFSSSFTLHPAASILLLPLIFQI